MKAAVTMAMVAKIIGTILYFTGWRLWAHREKHNSASIPYSDDVKGGVVTNAHVTTDSDNREFERELNVAALQSDFA